MKAFFLIVIFSIDISASAQFCASLHSELVKQFSNDSTGDGNWVYYPEKAEMVRIDKPLVKSIIPNYDFYSITLTNYLGYHVNEGRCLLLFDSLNSEIQLIPPIWYGDISKVFIKQFLHKKFESDKALFAFMDELNSLMEIGSGYRFLNTLATDSLIRYDLGYFKGDSYTTTGAGITSTIRYPQDGVWRKVKIEIKNHSIIRYSFLNPATKQIETIE